MSRRQLLQLAALGSGVGLAGLPLAGCTQAQLDAIANRPVRKEITTSAAATDVATYAQAVTAMQGLPSSDLRNWTNQATIHFDHCRHGSWLFFPWHRAYLFYFEQICRELTGVATFALPYWNWTVNSQIPAQFWNTANSLYLPPCPNPWSGSATPACRIATATDTLPSSAFGQPLIDSFLAQTNFLTFAGNNPGYGQIEQTPHNILHNFVSGTMVTFMSPLDPIFWTHHCRCDELWMEWNILRNNPNTNDPTWTNTEFDEFCDGKGNPVQISVLATVLMPLLSYKYDTQP